MNIDYAIKTQEVIIRLEEEGYSAKTVNEHRRCFVELHKHLLSSGASFTMEEGLAWLESRKNTWVMSTYGRYRCALYRFEKYLRCGEISRDSHCGNNNFVYHDTDVSYNNLPSVYKEVYRKFHEVISGELAKNTVEHYVVGCTDFLLFLSTQGCATPEEMTIDYPVQFMRKIREDSLSGETKQKYTGSVWKLLEHLAIQGCIPRCYAHVIRNLEDGDAITSLKLKMPVNTQPCFQPSKALEASADFFMASINERQYKIPPQEMFGHMFRNFFLFLEINHLAYSADTVWLWLKHIPKHAGWKNKRLLLVWFADYLETGSVVRVPHIWNPTLIDSLPIWSREIIENYLSLRQKEGRELSTLASMRSPCVRFFRFLDSKGVNSPGEITHSLVKEFHDTDPHSTSRAGNSYARNVKKLLQHMGEENIVPKNLYHAISAKCASTTAIVSVMSDDMIAAVYQYRKNSTSPYELRNMAMVMLGMRMGIRSCDIVKLKISDFDLKSRTVSFVQTKTKKAITLHIPIDVGNDIYKYIMRGRPQSGEQGFIFVKHNSPYSSLTKDVCNYALSRVLAQSGLNLPKGQGFHITRRTFATRLLKARTKVDSIADALGHATRMNVNEYISHDEEGMRLCPLSFSMGGVEQ